MTRFSSASYSALVAAQLRASLRRMRPEWLARHAAAVAARRTPEGGFRGRRGGPDLYYTGFGVRALHALGRLEAQAEPVGTWLSSADPANLIDLLSWLDARYLLGFAEADAGRVAGLAEEFRTPDGGYGKAAADSQGSTYHSFLAFLCYDLLGARPPRLDALGKFIHGRRREDGGFCEHAAARRSSTNATAAGVLLAALFVWEDPPSPDVAARCLGRLQDGSGGWLSTGRAPVADLLSTYTAMAALTAIDGLTRGMAEAAAGFAARCERAEGGFGGGPWDEEADVEYTWYGLGVAALAALHGIAWPHST